MRVTDLIALAAVGGAVAVGLLRDAQHRDGRALVASAWVDAAERADARWFGREETGQPLLMGFPSRDDWDRCADRAAGAERCDAVWKAMTRFLPADADAGFKLVERVGAEALLEDGDRAARSLYPVAWGSQGLQRSPEGLAAVALGTATLLGSPANRQEAIAGLAKVRDAVNESCRCAPPAGPLRRSPSPVAGASRNAERIVRSPITDHDPNPLIAPMVAVRRGEAIDPAWWQQPGVAGMLALELGRAGRTDQLDALVEASVTGPTGSDRMAALWAAGCVAPVEDWNHPQAQERARAVGW